MHEAARIVKGCYGHDSSYKFLFSTPELVRDLIIGFVPDDWLHGLDYTTLEKVPGSYITEDFRNRADDNAQGGIPYRIA